VGIKCVGGGLWRKGRCIGGGGSSGAGRGTKKNLADD